MALNAASDVQHRLSKAAFPRGGLFVCQFQN
jgi:hypothetical protein